MEIKLLVAVGEGKVFSLSVSQGLWVENNEEAHWQIDCLINEAMQDAREELDYDRWFNSGYDDEGEYEEEWKEAS